MSAGEAWDGQPFTGAKLVALAPDGALLTYLRDDFDHLPWPGCWDLPGGGREGDETPVETVLRELDEEFGLALPPARLVWHHRRAAGALPGHYYGAHLTVAEIAAIRFGPEGQFWQLSPLDAFYDDPRTIPHQMQIVRAFAASQRVGTGTSPR
ncbi:NUDIX hydrolase [Frigidibacter sp. MR17.14]|uniref:NUDIX hydrolase n=1 Tax=Frigidibacter sp. MR17.14 TaxID=3126509 RepID=UPI003012ED2C